MATVEAMTCALGADDMLDVSIERLRGIYARHGVWGALSQIPVNASRAPRAWSPKRRRARREDLAFDRRHGSIRPRRPRWPRSASRRQRRPRVEYKPSGIAFVRAALGRLDIAHAQYSFVDLGSGKGRALLLASHLPFRRIIGVEFSPKLTAIAGRTSPPIDQPIRLVGRSRRCAPTPALRPARRPAGDLSLQRLRRRHPRAVARNLAADLDRTPRDVLLLYVNPVAPGGPRPAGRAADRVRDRRARHLSEPPRPG